MRESKIKEKVASMLGVGKKRVWIDPSRLEEVKEAMTRDDLRRLIERGVIRILPKGGQSTARAKVLKIKKRKGRRRGPGSRKGSRVDEKREWIKRVRALRRALRILRGKGIITPSQYRELYRKVKGGHIRSKSHLAEIVRGS